jgi:Leucine-rich repeat (LRR) protein
LISRVLYWTGGQPLLTIKFCAALAESQAKTIADVDAYVGQNSQSLKELRTDIHFQQVLRFVEMRFSSRFASLRLYKKVLRENKVKADTTLPHLQLELSGLVKRDEAGFFVERNRLYAQLFNEAWLKTTNAMRQMERYRIVAATAGVIAVLAVAALGYSEYNARLQQKEIQYLVDEMKIQADGNPTTGYNLRFPNDPDSSLLTTVAAKISNKNIVRGIIINFRKPDKYDISNISIFPNLEIVQLFGLQIYDLSPLKDLKKLRHVSLARAEISDLRPLAGLTDLTSLAVWGNPISTIDALRDLTNLEELDISMTDVSDLEPLAGLTHLSNLDISETKISDLTPLTGLKNLSVLDVSGTLVDNLEPLSKLGNLTGLDVTGTNVRNFAVVNGMKSLEDFSAGNILGSRGIAAVDLQLTGAQSLRNLSLQAVESSDISKIPRSLTVFSVTNSRIGDWQGLSRLKSLVSLDVSGSNFTNADALNGLESLQALDLSKTKVSDVRPLANLKNLEELDLSGTNVTDLRPLQKLRRLRFLAVEQTDISDDEIDALKEALPPAVAIGKKSMPSLKSEAMKSPDNTRRTLR